MGAKDYSKEQMKVYSEGKIVFLDDYECVEIFGLRSFPPFRVPYRRFIRAQDKGHLNEIRQFGESINNGSGYPIPLWQLNQVTKISFEVEQQISPSK